MPGWLVGPVLLVLPGPMMGTGGEPRLGGVARGSDALPLWGVMGPTMGPGKNMVVRGGAGLGGTDGEGLTLPGLAVVLLVGLRERWRSA